MKTLRLTPHLNTEQVIAIIELIDELRDALCLTYHNELEDHRHQQWLERQDDQNNTDEQPTSDEMDPFDDPINF